MSQSETDLEQESRSIFRTVSGASLPAPPYLETRILATLRERQRRAPRLALWRSVAFGCAALLVAVAGFELTHRAPSSPLYSAEVHQAMLVNVEIRKLDTARIAYAEIALPEGVRFYSKAHPELAAQRNLIINWAPGEAEGTARFPFAIEGAVPGKRTVHVRFLDSERQPVLSREYEIRFRPEARS